MPKSFVYIMRCGNFVKVGHATKPRRRLSELQSANPTEISLEHIIECDATAVSLTEGLFHGLLAKHRHRGEWFSLSVREAVDILSKATGLYERAISLWGDSRLTAAQVAEETGIDLRTLYAQLGRRSVMNPVIKTGGNKVGPKNLKLSEEEVLRIWRDQNAYPDQREVARICGVAVRTLYNRFGPRNPISAAKRNTPSKRV